MSKIYFSRSITRTMSADHPVGDPTGGAAYGEKNDPVSAVLSVAAMGGTYAAAGSFAAMTVMQGLTFAGAAMSLVGNVTGNKTLSKIGMVAGIAGGIGSLAETQGWISKTPTLGETFGSAANTSAIPSSTAPLKGSPATSGELADEMAAQEKITAANRAAGAQTRGMGGQAEIAFQTGGPNPADTSYLKDVAAQPPADFSLTSGTSIRPDGGVGLTVNSAAGNTPQLNANQPGIWDTLKKGNLWEATKMAGSDIMSFAKDNPYGALAVGQTAAPIAEYLSGKTDAEIAALEAQTGYADANALRIQEEIAKEKRRRQNLSEGYAQVNTGINVNPAVLGQAQAGGLISGAMQPAA